jgi:ComF family protein
MLCRQCMEKESAPIRGVFSCPVCGRPTPSGTVCTETCRRHSHLAGVVCAAPYGPSPWRGLLHEYKYNGIEEAGEALEQFFSRFLESQKNVLGGIARRSVVTAVPLHYFRRARRGFNQSERFASAVGRVLDAEVRFNILSRRFRRRSQVGIDAASARHQNVLGSVVCRSGSVSGGRCIVVDDVMTTGSTLQACAAALKAAGYSEIWGLTLLRG